MEKCMGCLGLAFGSRRRKNRLRYRVNYGNNPGGSSGIEFDNLILNDDDQQMNYGTTCHFVSQEEKEIIAKREYDKILEQQRKIDEQISKQTFEEEERLRIEEERFREAQLEASKAVSAALKVQQYSKTGVSPKNQPDPSLYSIGDSDESDDDFELFLESVKVRSDAFRSDKTAYCDSIEPGIDNNNKSEIKVVSSQPRKLTPGSPLSGSFDPERPREIDGIADGMSSDGSFTYDNDDNSAELGLDNPEMEWDKFVDGLESKKVSNQDTVDHEVAEVS
uniref:AP-1 complex-associated regulatory protein-like n=1 Tax=Styela clava TaxID=7725 RepID=UPI0019399BE5|nr:AP-1 complex-associated regulatory protein-like [Styela clava]